MATKKAKILFLDIETAGNPAVLPLLPEPEVALGNIKDLEKIAAKIAEAKRKQVSDMALSPLTGYIVAIAYSIDGEETGVLYGNEESMLMTLSSMIDSETKLVTFNGDNFDLPFIFKRAVIKKITLSTILNDYVRSKKSIDLHTIWAGGYGKFVKFDTVCKMVLGKGKEEFDVLKIQEFIETDNKEMIEKMISYAKKDVDLLKELYQASEGILI